MKKGILLLLLGCSVFAQGQSIKDALFSGKLKNDPGTVIRKGDDLSTKIDTTTRKPAVDTVARIPVSAMDSATKARARRPDSAAVAATAIQDTAAIASETTTPAEPAAPVAAPKTNNALWKEFVDSVANTVKAEGLANKKIKKGTYYVTVTYAIETDGKVNITDVFVTPESAVLQSQVRTLLETDTPRLEPVLTSTGTPRKVTRKYNFTLTKE